MATRRRHPKRRVMGRKTAKRMSRMVKRGGGYEIGESLPVKCPTCDFYTLVYAGSEQIPGREKVQLCKCTNPKCRAFGDIQWTAYLSKKVR